VIAVGLIAFVCLNPAAIDWGMTLAEFKRRIRATIRAARQEGASTVEVTIGNEATVRIPLAPDKPARNSTRSSDGGSEDGEVLHRGRRPASTITRRDASCLRTRPLGLVTLGDVLFQ
jgi:hypothetical protein